MTIKILVATHKEYKIPEDDIYCPILVGANHNSMVDGFIPDNTGDNISSLNPFFCELTAIYWAWKNLDADYVGLVHYRRYFKGKYKSEDKFKCVLSSDEIKKLLKQTEIIVPKKQRYYIETIYKHYSHTHYKKDLRLVREILLGKYPEYISSWDKHMRSTSAHMFNMFVMKRELYDDYCSFIFPILFELQEKVDISNYDAFQARLFGRISELLLDVWIYKNQFDYYEVPVMYMEKINWPKKIISFLQAKFFKKKYSGSF